MTKRTTALALTLALAACTRPADVSRPLTAAAADKNAEFTVKDVPGGSTVDLKYSRYQFVPEMDALLVACRALAEARWKL